MPNNHPVTIQIERKPMTEKQRRAYERFFNEIIEDVKREQSRDIVPDRKANYG